ncbi:transmembrane channel-like protein 5 isoform X2 [Epargyreus clarus]|uniref:transmembrane channel-like protein 5 isoform X2 n=1 Tax=Epargyreus clarus TaxID=520877 RepID=UPI003C2FA544
MENENEIEDVEMKAAGIRRNLTLRNNVARQVAVNFMPSRQLSDNTLRLRRVNSEHNALLEAATSDAPDAVEKQADIIVREMEQHQRLMEDNPVSEELRREALRDLPQGLTMKRNVRAKLSASVSLRSKRRPISMFKRLKYRISFAFKRTSDRLRDFFFSIELWYEAIRNLEGHLGSAVGSYFHLLRWLFVLDLLFATLLVCFVVVPQLLHDEERESLGGRGFLDFISGTGSYNDSLLFYGHYHAGVISKHGLLTYNMPAAYFFTMLCLYLVFFVVLCYRTAYSYRQNFIETGGGLSAVFATKVFCGWDFGIVSQKAAALNANTLYNEFKELLNEQNRKKLNLTFCEKLGQRLVNVMVMVLSIGLIGGLQYGLWHLLTLETQVARWELCVSLIITATLALCPLFFNVIVKLEFYKARTAVYVTLARTWLLDLGTLLLLLLYWARSNTQCWESSFGQQAYRLVLLDALVSLLVLPAIEVFRGSLYKWNPKSVAPEFNIAYNSLTLLYNQALLWLGALFSPLLATAVAAKFLLLFYLKRETALRACHPARKVWRAAQTQTILYMLVTLSLFTALFGLGLLFVRRSSPYCGPFREYERVFHVVSEGVLGLSRRPALRAVLVFLARPGVIGFVLLFLCVAVYYMRAKAGAQRSLVALLRHMLRLQAKDKDFLLSAIGKVSNGEWLYNPKPEEQEGPDSHTWKYLHEVRKPSNAGYNFDGSRLSHAFLERPLSYAKDARPASYHTERRRSTEDGDTDSSFSWQGSSSLLNQKADLEAPEKRWL